MNFKGSKTEANLIASMTDEAKAFATYTSYAARAREDGYEQIGDIFDESARNEHEHFEIWFKYLHHGEMPHTAENLADSIADEHTAWTESYRKAAIEAEEEGFDELAEKFCEVAEIERDHEMRFRKLLCNIEKDEVFKKPCKVYWICMVCGHVHYGFEAPDPCPVCGYPKAFQEIECRNY